MSIKLLAKKSHRRRAENDDTLLVQADDPLIRTKIEQFCEVQIFAVRRLVPARLRLHDTPFYGSIANPLRAAFLCSLRSSRIAQSSAVAICDGFAESTNGVDRGTPP